MVWVRGNRSKRFCRRLLPNLRFHSWWGFASHSVLRSGSGGLVGGGGAFCSGACNVAGEGLDILLANHLRAGPKASRCPGVLRISKVVNSVQSNRDYLNPEVSTSDLDGVQ